MQKPYRKQHIYAFVVNKKISSIFIALIAGVFMFIPLLGFLSESHNLYTDIYNSFYMKFTRLSDSEKGLAEALKPDMDMIMKTASPILGGETAEKDTELIPEPPEKASDTAKKYYRTKEKNIKSEQLSFKNETSYSVDLPALCRTPTTYDACGDLPRVLILHTHACEAYSTIDGAPDGDNGTYRSTSNLKNMVAIGERIHQNLTTAGINSIHDTALCDYPTYNTAYQTSLEVANNYLKKYPTINFIFDIHRDAISDENSTPIKLTSDVGGNKTAQIMSVCGTDAMGLNHPGWIQNLTLASKIQKYLETKYPGVARPLNIRRERFNMHTTPGSLIFEIGTHANTMDEAIRGADILSEALVEVLMNKF